MAIEGKVSALELREMIARVTPSASSDSSRVQLTGVQLEADCGGLRMRATDSYRAAWGEIPYTGEVIHPVVVSARDLRAMKFGRLHHFTSAALEVNGAFQVQVPGKPARTAELFGSEFPNLAQITPQTFDTTVTVHAAGMAAILEKFESVSGDTIPLRLALSAGGSSAYVDHPDWGELTKVFDAEVAGDAAALGVNLWFLLEGLEAVGGGEVTIGLNGSLKPLKITGPKGHYLLMPVRLS